MIETRGNRVVVVAKENLTRRKTRKLDAEIADLTNNGFQVEVLRTPNAKIAEDQIKKRISERAVDAVGVLGGDGKLRTAAQAIETSDVPADQLPILFQLHGDGSVKVFQKATENDMSPSQTLKEGKCYELDVIKATIDGGKKNGGQELYLLSNASLGHLIGGLFNLKDRAKHSRGGVLGYAPFVLKAIRHSKDFTVDITIDGKEEEKKTYTASELFTLNAGKGGFISFGPDETYDGKQMYLIAFNKAPLFSSRWTRSSSIVQGLIYDARHPGEESEFEERSRGKKIRIDIKDGQEIPLQLDGDGVGVVRSSLELSIAEKPIRVMVKDQSRPGWRRKIEEWIGFQRTPFRNQGEQVIWKELTPSTSR